MRILLVEVGELFEAVSRVLFETTRARNHAIASTLDSDESPFKRVIRLKRDRTAKDAP